MRVLIAPQEFKGSLSAEEATDSIARGIRRAQPSWKLDLCPMSDGGPGLLEALRRSLRSDTLAAVVHDPLRRKVLGRYAMVRGTRDAVLEAAQANGIMHVAADEMDPLRADTFGVGELIADAVLASPSRIIIGVGGSATTDGGAGMARALGARFLDSRGEELAPGGAALAALARIEWVPPEWAEETPVTVATDVTNPLLSPNGAAAIYAPQKGASPEDVVTLERGLERFAAVVRETLGVDIAEMPGAGAAGGLAGGLVAFLGAQIVSGFDVVADAVRLRERLEGADIVITGEGNFDAQSLQGKVTGRIAAMAREAGKPVVVFAGGSTADVAEVRTLRELEPDAVAAMRGAGELLTRLAREWAAGQLRD